MTNSNAVFAFRNEYQNLKKSWDPWVRPEIHTMVSRQAECREHSLVHSPQ
jgi:hypothetical protein